MSDCCTPRGYRWIFSESMARSEASRYRRRGLDATSRRIVEAVKAQGVDGRTVLEIGGGIGAVQIELLKAGATRARCIELTPTYEEVAAELLRESGLEERVERQVADFTTVAAAVEPADIVIMNRVVCCYPDMPALAGAAADHARHVMVLSFPRGAWWIRLGICLANVIFKLTRREFKVFVHAPVQILATAQRHGLDPVRNDAGWLWTVAAVRRQA